MKRITRDRRLSPEEAAKYQAIRRKVAEELPELIGRHHERMTAREAKGLSLADVAERTGR